MPASPFCCVGWLGRNGQYPVEMPQTAESFMRATAIAASFVFALVLDCALAAEPAGPSPGETLSQSYRGSQRDNLAYQKIPPIKLFDNLYYVGPGYVSAWLIPTSAGLIL